MVGCGHRRTLRVRAANNLGEKIRTEGTGTQSPDLALERREVKGCRTRLTFLDRPLLIED